MEPSCSAIIGLLLLLTVFTSDITTLFLSFESISQSISFLFRKTVSKLVVVLGDHNSEEEDEGEEQRLVNQVVLHPKYSHSNYNNDLALLRLQRPVAFTK